MPSSRELPSKLREFEYGDTAEVRRVRSDGGIKWNGISVFVGTALRGELVGIEPVGVNDWHVYLGSLRLGALVEDKNLIVPFE